MGLVHAYPDFREELKVTHTGREGRRKAHTLRLMNATRENDNPRTLSGVRTPTANERMAASVDTGKR